MINGLNIKLDPQRLSTIQKDINKQISSHDFELDSEEIDEIVWDIIFENLDFLLDVTYTVE